MSQSIEDSNQKAILVGGAIIPQEDRKIEIPPEQAKDFSPIVDTIEIGEVIEIQTVECNLEKELPKEQLEVLKARRKENRPWKTEKANRISKTGKEI